MSSSIGFGEGMRRVGEVSPNLATSALGLGLIGYAGYAKGYKMYDQMTRIDNISDSVMSEKDVTMQDAMFRIPRFDVDEGAQMMLEMAIMGGIGFLVMIIGGYGFARTVGRIQERDRITRAIEAMQAQRRAEAAQQQHQIGQTA